MHRDFKLTVTETNPAELPNGSQRVNTGPNSNYAAVWIPIQARPKRGFMPASASEPAAGIVVASRDAEPPDLKRVTSQ